MHYAVIPETITFSDVFVYVQCVYGIVGINNNLISNLDLINYAKMFQPHDFIYSEMENL